MRLVLKTFLGLAILLFAVLLAGANPPAATTAGSTVTSTSTSTSTTTATTSPKPGGGVQPKPTSPTGSQPSDDSSAGGTAKSVEFAMPAGVLIAVLMGCHLGLEKVMMDVRNYVR